MKLTEAAQRDVRALAKARAEAEKNLQMYLQGLKAGMNLEGDYRFNFDRMEFEDVNQRKSEK
jgi:hypothetical protein